MAQVETFGTLKDGREVRAVTLSRPGGLAVQVLEFGAIIHQLRVPTAGGPVDAILSYETLAEYEADKAFLDCIIGRCANRIDHGRFTIDGRTYQVSTNEGPNTLHGGKVGWDKRLWSLEDTSREDRCSLTYSSPDGEEGFPGRVEARVTLTLTDPLTLEIAYEATTDKPTPVNLTHHCYFNLTGDRRATILDHTLRIAGPDITPVRPDLIPTGDYRPVQGTPFDLLQPRRIGGQISEPDPQIEIGGGFDMNWALDRAAPEAVTLRSPETGLSLHIATDQPGVQVYSGQGLKTPFVRHSAIVFEPQGFPDAMNHPDFPNVILRPGETYRHRSLYRFEAGPPG